MKKIQHISIFLFISILLFACAPKKEIEKGQIEVDKTNGNQTEETEQEEELEENLEEVLEEEEEVEELIVRKDLNWVNSFTNVQDWVDFEPLDNSMLHQHLVMFSIHFWNFEEKDRIYLVAEEGEFSKADFTSASQAEDDLLFHGKLSFIAVKGDQAIELLQLEDTYINFSRALSDPYEMGEHGFITLSAQEESNNHFITMWHYDNERLRQTTFEDYDRIVVSHKNLKFIKDEFLQSYIYSNHDMENGVGWYYSTYQYDDKENRFSLVFENHYTDQQKFEDGTGWDVGEYITERWLEIPTYYDDFPQITSDDE